MRYCARLVSVSCAGAMASLTNSVKFYDLGRLGAGRGERVGFTEAADNSCDTNCVDVRILRGPLLLGHLKVAVAARFSPLMRGVAAEVTGYISRYFIRTVFCVLPLRLIPAQSR